MKVPPTAHQFTAYQALYDYFVAALFDGKLSPCLLNFSRKANTLGFFAPERWTRGKSTVHEISLNPAHLGREPRDVASTLVHEMVHAWQTEHGTPSRRGYHNTEWATKMEALGLMPSATGAPHGARVGERMSHYVVDGGPFDRAFRKVPHASLLPWLSFDDTETKAKRPASKVKYTCPECETNVWGKPDIAIACAECSDFDDASIVLFAEGDVTG